MYLKWKEEDIVTHKSVIENIMIEFNFHFLPL